MWVKRCWRRWLLTIYKNTLISILWPFQWVAFSCLHPIRHTSDNANFYPINLENTWKGYTSVLIELTVTAHRFFRVRAPELNTSQSAASAEINERDQKQSMLHMIKTSILSRCPFVLKKTTLNECKNASSNATYQYQHNW